MWLCLCAAVPVGHAEDIFFIMVYAPLPPYQSWTISHNPTFQAECDPPVLCNVSESSRNMMVWIAQILCTFTKSQWLTNDNALITLHGPAKQQTATLSRHLTSLALICSSAARGRACSRCALNSQRASSHLHGRAPAHGVLQVSPEQAAAEHRQKPDEHMIGRGQGFRGGPRRNWPFHAERQPSRSRSR